MNSSTQAPPPAIIGLHATTSLGPWLLGTLADFLFQGMLLVMAMEYYSKPKNDRTWVRWIVHALFVTNIIKTVQGAAIQWNQNIVGFGSFLSILVPPWYQAFEALSSEIITIVAQSFFVGRLYGLLGRRYLCVLLSLVMAFFVRLGCTTYLTVFIIHAGPGLKDTELKIVAIIAVIAGVLVLLSDVLVTGLTSFYLMKVKTGYKQTDNVIKNLVKLTITTAALPAILSAISLPLYLTISGSGNNTFIFFNIIGPRLYTFSVMYTLNSREALVAKSSVPTTASVKVTTNTVHFYDAHEMANLSGAPGARQGPIPIDRPASPTSFIQDIDSDKGVARDRLV